MTSELLKDIRRCAQAAQIVGCQAMTEDARAAERVFAWLKEQQQSDIAVGTETLQINPQIVLSTEWREAGPALVITFVQR